DEPTQVYEEYEGYPTTDSETLSSILPLPNNLLTTTSQKNHYKRGRPHESFICQHFSDHDLNNVSILKQILQPDNDVVGNYNEISHYLSSNVIQPFS
ncbi:5362_t:CDS:2, partial [Entrophospora sp. SA101]